MSGRVLISEDGWQLTSEGEQLYAEIAAANPDRARLIPVFVGGDWWARDEADAATDRCVLPAFLARSVSDGSIDFWNGFVQPWFTREVAEKCVELQGEMIAEVGDEYVEALRFEDDTIVVSIEGQYREETPEAEHEWRIEPVVFGRTPMYGIGHAYWTWQMVGDTLDRDPFHAWLRECKEAGERLGSPAGNPALLARFALERSQR